MLRNSKTVRLNNILSTNVSSFSDNNNFTKKSNLTIRYNKKGNQKFE